MGYFIAHWENDDFVVETTGFKDGGWLDTEKARPNSDALHVTERFRREGVARMILTITIDDVKASVKPWTVTTRLSLMADTELIESFCDGQRKHDQLRRIESVTPEPPSPPLPRTPR